MWQKKPGQANTVEVKGKPDEDNIKIAEDAEVTTDSGDKTGKQPEKGNSGGGEEPSKVGNDEANPQTEEANSEAAKEDN